MDIFPTCGLNVEKFPMKQQVQVSCNVGDGFMSLPAL
jgi:hypothetical protein